MCNGWSGCGVLDAVVILAYDGISFSIEPGVSLPLLRDAGAGLANVGRG